MNKQTEHVDEESVIDTSKMNADKAAAMNLAESARDNNLQQNSFAGQLFMGSFQADLIYPFPEQSVEEKQIGDLNHRLIPVDSTSYEYNINTDDIPDIIEVEFEVPPMSKVWLEYSIDGFPISREGNWKYDKAIVTKSGGQMTLKQSTSSGIWWLE